MGFLWIFPAILELKDRCAPQLTWPMVLLPAEVDVGGLYIFNTPPLAFEQPWI